MVVGCGLGTDAEYLASRRFDTIGGFDVSETAIRLASQRFPGSRVRDVTADVLDLPVRFRSCTQPVSSGCGSIRLQGICTSPLAPAA